MMDEEEDMDWFGGEYRSSKGLTTDEVVRDWFEGSRELLSDINLSTRVPEIVWSAILEILQHEMTDEQEAMLAAGPVESVLALHGPAFIDRVELQAAQDSRFNHLLGGVWQHATMRWEIWERVQRARKEVW